MIGQSTALQPNAHGRDTCVPTKGEDLDDDWEVLALTI